MFENIDWSQWGSVFGTWGPRLLVVILIIAGGLLLARLAQSVVLRWGRSLGIDDVRWVAAFTRMAILFAAGLVTLQNLGVDVGVLTSLIAVVAGAITGSAALALALGGKAIVSDILGAYHLKKLFHLARNCGWPARRACSGNNTHRPDTRKRGRSRPRVWRGRFRGVW